MPRVVAFQGPTFAHKLPALGDERTLAKSPGFSRLQSNLSEVLRAILDFR